MKAGNFRKKDDSFVCRNCGLSVMKLGYTSRDHCPDCLYSIHVDIMPGDRASPCRGSLKPIGLKLGGKKTQIVYKCTDCGEIKKNIIAEDDNGSLLIELSSKPIDI